MDEEINGGAAMKKEEAVRQIVDILNKKVSESGQDKVSVEMASQKLEVSSLVFLQLLTDVEKAFSIQIEDDYWEYNRLNSIEKIAEYVVLKQ